MTQHGSKPDAGTLPYERVKREKPIPIWKHIVFAPLLFWVGMFILGTVAATLWAIWEILRMWLRG